MSVPTRAPPPAPVPCKNCSHEVTPETRRCPYCGQEKPGAVDIRDTTRGLVAASVFTLVVFIAVLLLFAFVV